MNISKIGLIGVNMDLGAVRKGVDKGPASIRAAGLVAHLQKQGYTIHDYGDIIPPVVSRVINPKMRYQTEIAQTNKKLFLAITYALQEQYFPVILGGDHSIAMGSIAATLETYSSIGVIWVDAHGDFNDETITPSGNIHGMPLSALCGYGPDSLLPFCKKRVDPSHVVILGARDLDPLEKNKLQNTNVTIFSMQQIQAQGIEPIIREAICIAGNGTKGIHLSFDMDALDPSWIPGVGTPVAGGLTIKESQIICQKLVQSGKLIAIDIVETNPLLDKDNITAQAAARIICTCLGDSKKDYDY